MVKQRRELERGKDDGQDSELQYEEDDNAVDSRLLLHIRGLSGLVNRSVHGVCNPYCRVILDARTLDTRVHGDATTSPDIRKDYVLPVNISQWGRSFPASRSGREPFITDEFLGQVVLPLKDMAPEVEQAVIEGGHGFPPRPKNSDETSSSSSFAAAATTVEATAVPYKYQCRGGGRERSAELGFVS